MVHTLFAASLLLQSLNVVVNGFILPALPLTNEETWKEDMSIRKKSTTHAEFSQESSVVTQAKVMTAPRDASQTFQYKADTIYVRECYHTYYNKIIDKLLGKLDYYFISVTGSSCFINTLSKDIFIRKSRKKCHYGIL
jgi:hypothetical protein